MIRAVRDKAADGSSMFARKTCLLENEPAVSSKQMDQWNTGRFTDLVYGTDMGNPCG